MKTVGIATTFHQPNWGSVLQAYATQKIVDSLGYKSFVIDYKYPQNFHKKKQKIFFYSEQPSKLKLHFLKFRHMVARFLGVRAKNKAELVDEFINNEMRVTKFYNSYKAIHKNPPKFDIYLSGSDQIWNPNTMSGDMSYFFDYAPDDAVRISYSASFSCNDVPDEYIQLYKKYLLMYKAISVREKNGADLVRRIAGREAEVVLDPTLMLKAEDWAKLACKSVDLHLPPRYIVAYTLAYTYNPLDKMAALLKALQQEYNLPVVSLNMLPPSFDGSVYSISKRLPIGVNEFLNIMMNAEIVATSSFHGTAYSINFGKPFISLIDGTSGADDRIKTILSDVGLENNCLTTESELNLKAINPYYDVVKAQLALDKLRSKSWNFLRNALNE